MMYVHKWLSTASFLTLSLSLATFDLVAVKGAVPSSAADEDYKAICSYHVPEELNSEYAKYVAAGEYSAAAGVLEVVILERSFRKQGISNHPQE